MSKFTDLPISKEVLQSISKMGYEKPTEVQEKTIPIVAEGSDIIAQAQTGTGKTAAFGIPLIDKVNTNEKKIQALILVPTRELAIQVARELKDIGKTKKAFVLAVYGGKSIYHQIKFLKKGNDVIVVGTPGRVKDLIDRGYLKLNNVKHFVLDEADRMLDMGFIEDIEYIMSKLPKEKQILLFSATMPNEIKKLAEEFLSEDYKTVKIAPEKVTVDRIKQIAYRVDNKNKFSTFMDVLQKTMGKKSIVFTQTKLMADEVAEKLQEAGFNASAIHGDFSQAKRERTLKNFRTGKLDILVATDVAARGLDIKGVETVYNYELPQDVESYVHRIGRTGRAGKEGVAISFFTPSEDSQFQRILKITKANIELINLSDKPFNKPQNKRKRRFVRR
ncbi:DEAD/DEAH box helicase [Hydrogenothermus marinus]|uniref:DEAD-box ATP-dependent RNA helicase RhpA n=1 Tax=Hydrogenothermus marinus TaxID=133270 RepID=A0A3M0BI35_9AQUI|nr:DEAD/DEAH box helicase [Hydrogenothermus marinus]RMA97083.1 ATP-dependent RNA helicase DeaD [Hydrogenothermus marinus]